MPSQKASTLWGYIRDLRALAIISFRPYGDCFFSQIPILLPSAMLLVHKLGNAGTCSLLCSHAHFPLWRGFYLARDSFRSGITSDQMKHRSAILQMFSYLSLFKRRQEGGSDRNKFDAKGINLGKCLRKQVSYLLMLKEQP
jgi:hypothetical protein